MNSPTISPSRAHRQAVSVCRLPLISSLSTSEVFTISTISGTAFGIAGTGPQQRGIAVRNGSISGFTRGVELSNADGSIVEGLRVFGGNTGADVNGITANGIVKGNTVISYEVGIEATGTVTGNYAALNSDVGLSIGPGSTVIGNTDTGSSGFGFFVICPSNLTDNTAVNNTRGNLFLSGEAVTTKTTWRLERVTA
jgi:hypothetical protein